MRFTHRNGLSLGKAEREDLDLLYNNYGESWKGHHNFAVINRSDQENWYKSLNDRSLVLIAYDETNYPVGLYKMANMDRHNNCYDSGHDVFPDSRGKGLGSQVLMAGVDFGMEIMGFHRINTEVRQDNPASIKNALSVGYIYEGMRRKAVYCQGEYINSLVYGLVREDWLKLTRVMEGKKLFV